MRFFRWGRSLKQRKVLLGDMEFVLQVLHDADEKLSLKEIEKKLCDVFEIEPEDIYTKSREKLRADARGLYCYWAVRELGYQLTDLARSLGMTQPGVGYAVRRGERIAKDNNIQLKE